MTLVIGRYSRPEGLPDTLVAAGEKTVSLPTATDVPPILAPKRSLLTTTESVGTDIPDGSAIGKSLGRWQRTIGYLPLIGGPTDLSYGKWAECSTGSNRTKTFDGGPSAIDYTPYVAWAADLCGSFGNEGMYYAERAQLRLELMESFIVAGELWDGALATQEGLPNQFFSQGGPNVATTLAAGAAQTAIAALAYLDDALSRCLRGPVGFIHCTPATAVLWSNLGVIDRVDDSAHLETINGTIVVSDAGYPGTGPNGVPATSGNVWAYATGPVYTRRDKIEVIGDPLGPSTNYAPVAGFDAATNFITTLAERTVAAWWDNECLFAVKIDAPYVA